MEEQKIELKIINMADIQSQEIEWLWYPLIPYGKLTIIQGDPGDGKTTLVLNLAAKLSKGVGLDEDMPISEPMACRMGRKYRRSSAVSHRKSRPDTGRSKGRIRP